MTKQLFQIASGAPGKQCDFYPHGSLHTNREKIHSFCDVIEVDPNIETKVCPQFCGITFPKDWPFVKASQIGDEDMCVRCYGKKYIVMHYNYFEAVRAELLIDIKYNERLEEIEHLKGEVQYLKDLLITEGHSNF